MKDKMSSWLMAFVVGMFVPAILISIAERILPLPPKKTETEITVATEPTEPTQGQQSTPGGTVAVLMSDGNTVIMDMNEYLTAVVLGEMPADFEFEALKAQAVVARTYALKCIASGSKHANKTVCTNAACCQAYQPIEVYLESGGKQSAVEKVRAAVNDTTGHVLTYNGALIEATYFSCSGGRTEDALAVWGTDVPYLKAVDSPGEENAKWFTDRVRFSAAEFASRLQLVLTGSPSGWFGSVTRTSGGGVDTMEIGGVIFKGTELRQRLGLRSTAFSVTVVGELIYVSTKGYGHRVGMSQYGADAMALNGYGYTQILEHYYPGTVLESYLQN